MGLSASRGAATLWNLDDARGGRVHITSYTKQLLVPRYKEGMAQGNLVLQEDEGQPRECWALSDAGDGRKFVTTERQAQLSASKVKGPGLCAARAATERWIFEDASGLVDSLFGAGQGAGGAQSGEGDDIGLYGDPLLLKAAYA